MRNSSGVSGAQGSTFIGRLGGNGREGVRLISCLAVVVKAIDARILTMPGQSTRRVFTDQADIACTKREAP